MSSDKRPHTTYIDYLHAAEVHIAACKELRRRLKKSHDLYRNLADRNKIRQEIYYLSGYIIESVICYAVGDILDKLNPAEDIHKENILSINKSLNTPWGKEKVTFNFLFKENEHKIRNKQTLFHKRIQKEWQKIRFWMISVSTKMII